MLETVKFLMGCLSIFFNVINNVDGKHQRKVTVAEWIVCLLTVREVSQSNPGTLPLLHACRKPDWLPCWPSTRGESEVKPEVNLRNPLCAGKEACK